MKIIKIIEAEARSASHPGALAWDGRTLLPLADGWALGCDSNQWMVMRARRHKSKLTWQPVSFIGSNTGILRRELRDRGIDLPDGVLVAALNGAKSFLEWRTQVGLDPNDSGNAEV